MRLTRVGLVSVASAFLFNSAGGWSAAPEDVVLRNRMIYECYMGNVEAVVEYSRRLETLDYRAGPFPPGKCLTIENGDSWTPLTAAIQGRHWAIASYLIGCGASADFTTGERYAPIWIVAYQAHGDPQAVALATLLLKWGANVRTYPTAPSPFPETPLCRAAACGEVEITRLLLAYGADLDEHVDSAPPVRSRLLEFYGLSMKLRKTSPFLRSPSEWKRAKEMYDLLNNTARREEALGENGHGTNGSQEASGGMRSAESRAKSALSTKGAQKKPDK